jgi:GAF domain-containing protein
VEFRVRHEDGSLRVLEAIGVHPADDPTAGFVVHSRDVSERRAAEDRSAVLLEVARDLATTLDPAEILDRVQRRMVAVLPCDTVTTYQWDEVAQRFRLVADYGTPPAVRDEMSTLSFKSAEPFGGRLYEGPVVLSDAASAPGMAGQIAARFGVGPLLAAPLRVPGRYFGALSSRSSPRTASRQTTSRRFGW